MSVNWKVEQLLSGTTITSKEPGNSMTPILKSRQAVVLEPTDWTKVVEGDIVYAKVQVYGIATQKEVDGVMIKIK